MPFSTKSIYATAFIIFFSIALSAAEETKKEGTKPYEVYTSFGSEFYKNKKPSTSSQVGMSISKFEHVSFGGSISHISKPTDGYFTIAADSCFMPIALYSLDLNGEISVDYESFKDLSASLGNSFKINDKLSLLAGYDMTYYTKVFLHTISPGVKFAINENLKLKTTYGATITQSNEGKFPWSHAGSASLGAKLSKKYSMKFSLSGSQKYYKKAGKEFSVGKAFTGKAGVGLKSWVSDIFKVSVDTSFKMKNDYDYSAQASLGISIPF